MYKIGYKNILKFLSLPEFQPLHGLANKTKKILGLKLGQIQLQKITMTCALRFSNGLSLTFFVNNKMVGNHCSHQKSDPLYDDCNFRHRKKGIDACCQA